MLLAFFIALLILIVLALPWVIESRRTPMTDRYRRKAKGVFADLSRGQTHYQWHGPRSPRVLVMVHGLSSPSWVFDGLIRSLMRMNYRVLTYDLYGRGMSDAPRGAQSLEFHVEQLQELLNSLGARMPVTLVGYSMGGAIATAFAALEPDRIERLVLLAPAGIVYTPAPLNRFARDHGFLGSWVWGMFGARSLRRAAHDEQKVQDTIPDLHARIVTETRRRGYLPAILSSERHALTSSVEEAHREIGAMCIPTLAVFGEADPVIPLSAVGHLAEWNRNAYQHVLPGVGHGLVYTNTEDVLDALRDFLREVPG